MTTISNVILDPSTTTAPTPPAPHIAGYVALLIALMENADAIQNYVANGLMPLTEAISQQGLNYSNAWVKVLDADMAKVKKADKDHVSAAVAQFNLDNTLSGQAQTYYNGLSSGASDTTSKTNDQASNDYQMAQQSALTIMATITAAIAA
ncbi:MAG: hypothetical protein A3E80_06415 [Chlamydiae bacterium RIFCSPHIGHO2_12_FULL_49_9]|nr:MAG: hypothetical protein A3E80_06415 [Chlamydiae bacterium RIFCSPHIGHO2_12_FULL_49_9]